MNNGAFLGLSAPKAPFLQEKNMIAVTQLNGKQYWINPHQIECIEVNPDVTLVMLSGRHVVVREKPDDIIDRIIEYRRRIGAFKNEE